jgi:hypothetical protein
MPFMDIDFVQFHQTGRAWAYRLDATSHSNAQMQKSLRGQTNLFATEGHNQSRGKRSAQ